MKVLDILLEVKNNNKTPAAAEKQIKLIFEAVVDNAAIGISNVDATEMYGEIMEELDKT